MDRKEGLLARVPRDLTGVVHQVDLMDSCGKARRNSCQCQAAHVSEQLCQVSEVSEVISHLSGGQTFRRHLGSMTEDPSRDGNRVKVTSSRKLPRRQFQKHHRVRPRIIRAGTTILTKPPKLREERDRGLPRSLFPKADKCVGHGTQEHVMTSWMRLEEK